VNENVEHALNCYGADGRTGTEPSTGGDAKFRRHEKIIRDVAWGLSALNEQDAAEVLALAASIASKRREERPVMNA
jgi:hypothetical protein